MTIFTYAPTSLVGWAKQNLVLPPCHSRARTESTNREADFDDEPSVNGGVLIIKHKHQSIFSQELELKTKELPRRKPRITIERRMIEAEDD